MMTNLKNSVTLIGRLGKDVETREFESGKKLASFSLATNESYTNNDGEKVTNTQWHTIIAWDKNAENVEKLLSKGDEVILTGKILYRSYEKDGVTKFVTEIHINWFHKTSSKEKTEG